MLLTTNDQLGHARRISAKVLVYSIDDNGDKRLEGFGTLFDFDENTVTIMTASLGLMHCLREVCQVQLVRSDAPSVE